MPAIEFESQSLPQIREFARLRYSHELAQAAGVELLSRMMIMAEDVRSMPRTDYLGREHFDAFTGVHHTLYNRQDSGRLFNHLVSPEAYGYREPRYTYSRRTPQRIIFGLYAQEIGGILITAPRLEVGLAEYPDEKPSGIFSDTVNEQTRNSLLDTAIEAGSFIDLVEYGERHKAGTQPKKPLTLEERLAIQFAEHVA